MLALLEGSFPSIIAAHLQQCGQCSKENSWRHQQYWKMVFFRGFQGRFPVACAWKRVHGSNGEMDSSHSTAQQSSASGLRPWRHTHTHTQKKRERERALKWRCKARSLECYTCKVDLFRRVQNLEKAIRQQMQDMSFSNYSIIWHTLLGAWTHVNVGTWAFEQVNRHGRSHGVVCGSTQVRLFM